MVRHTPDMSRQWLLSVVAETWDGYLNDINGSHVQPEHAMAAIDGAAGSWVEEGSVGGGTGMNCYGFKGGSGSASRVVEHGPDSITVGAFVQANFGSRNELTVAGVLVGPDLADDNPMADTDWLGPPGAGSVIVVVATGACRSGWPARGRRARTSLATCASPSPRGTAGHSRAASRSTSREPRTTRR